MPPSAGYTGDEQQPIVGEGLLVSTGPASAGQLAALVMAHHAALYRYAYRLCGGAADAEDLTQQAFLIAHRKLHQLREPDRAAGWLFAILRSCYLKWRRKRVPLTSTVAEVNLGEVPQDLPELQAVDSEELQAVLNDLAEELRLVLVMFYFEELSYKVIADQLEIPIGTVMSRLSRAKQKLRERLAPLNPETPSSEPAPLTPSLLATSKQPSGTKLVMHSAKQQPILKSTST